MVSEWVKEEMGSLDMGDKRLNKRLMHIITETSKQPGKSINRQFHTRKEMQACYRFHSNNLVNEEKIIAPHKKMTLNRAKKFPVVLCPSDTTSLNYTTRKGLKDSGYISSNNAQGFFMHATIAVTPERLHLGVIDQKIWAREKEKKANLVHRDLRPIEEKESYRWLEAYRITCKFAKSCKDTQVVHITDKEGDIFEVFAERESRQQEGCAAHFLMRCNHNRTVYLKNKKTSTLFKELKKNTPLGQISFELEVDGVIRAVVQNIYALTATIKSPDSEKSLSINSFCLEEIDPPEGCEPICWYLITSLPIGTVEEIEKAVKYYLCRWEIETFFKTIKSGCKIEEKSLRKAERLFSAFAIISIIAWRLNYLLHISRLMPEISCEFYFERSEWKAGTIAATRNKIPPGTAPNMGTMMEYITQLGGHQKCKNSLEAGIKALWVGLSSLGNYADAWDLFGPEVNHKEDLFVKKRCAQ